MYCTVVSLFTVAVLTIAAFGVGRLLLRWIAVPLEDRLTTITFSLGLGFATAGLFLLPFGLTGMICVPVLGTLAMLGCCWGIIEIVVSLLQFEERIRQGVPRRAEEPVFPWAVAIPPAPKRLQQIVLTAAGLAVAASLLTALAPPTGSDAISCQLESAKRMVVEHSILVAPADQAARPLLVDLWYVWAVAFDSGVCAQTLHWMLGILLALATATLATPLLGRTWAWLCGGLVLLTPAVNYHMSLPTDCVAFAAMCTLAVAAWWQAVVHRVERRWFVVAGIVGGGALGIHSSAVLLILAFVLVWGWIASRQVEQRQFLLQGGLTSLCVALSIAALYGIPLVLPAIRELSATPDTVDTSTGFFGHLGIISLAALPGVLLTRRLRGLGAALSVAALYCLFVLGMGGRHHWLLPAVPLLSLAAVWVWIELRRFSDRVRRLASVAFGLMLACNLAVSLARSPEAWLVAVGLEDREEYLLRHEPTYSAAAAANVLLRGNSHLLSEEQQAFYFDCHVTSDCQLTQLLANVPSVEKLQETAAALRNAGFTHLLLVEHSPNASRVAATASTAALSPLSNSRFRTADGSIRCYRLMAIR